MAFPRRYRRFNAQHGMTSAVLALSLFSAQTLATCYFPNGDIALNDAPCRTVSGHSTCCGVGYACMQSGICQLSNDTPSQLGFSGFVRASCTDQSWNSPACPMFCIDPDLNNVGGWNELGKCYDVSQDMYYCIDSKHNRTVCGNTAAGALYFVGPPSTVGEVRSLATTYSAFPPLSTKTRTTTTSSSTTTTFSTTSGTTATAVGATASSPSPLQPTSPPTLSNIPAAIDNTNATNNTAMIAGVTAGVVGGLILGGVLVWFFLRRRKQHKDQSSQVPTTANFPITINNNINNSRDSKYSTEKQWWWWYQQQQQQQQQQYNASQQHLPHTSLWQQHSQHSEVHAPSAYSGQNSLSSSGSTTVLHELRGGEVRSPQELPANQGSWS